MDIFWNCTFEQIDSLDTLKTEARLEATYIFIILPIFNLILNSLVM